MAVPELVLQFPDWVALQLEHTRNLAHGRALVPGVYELSVFSPCLLTLCVGGSEDFFQVPCEVVMVMEQGDPAVALQFTERTDTKLRELALFVARGADTAEEPPTGTLSLLPASDDDHPTGTASLLPDEEPPTGKYSSLPARMDDERDSLEGEDEGDDLAAGHASETQRAVIEARALKLRNLTPPQRMQVARGSVLEDRVLLERIYGSAVWELLLRNPKITVPEVARMARKGTMPRPLLDSIAENEQWIRHALIRRALLANPRLGTESVTRVLRTLPPRELKLVPHQTAYPASVRQVATRLMRGS